MPGKPAHRRRDVARSFSTLGLDVGATESEVRAAYRALARAHHPDKTGGDDETFRKIQRAYETAREKLEKDKTAREAMKATLSSSSSARVLKTSIASEKGDDEREEKRALEIRMGEDGSTLALGGDLKTLGDQSYADEEYERAIEYYTAAAAYAKVDGTAEYAELYHARGEAYAALGRWSAAVDDADRAIATRSLWFPPWVLKGRALEAMCAWSRAVDLYRECVARAKDDEKFLSVFADGFRRTEQVLLTECRITTVAAHKGAIIRLAMKPNLAVDDESDTIEPLNAYVATIGEDGYLKVFSVPRGDCVYSVKVDCGCVSHLEWSPDGDGTLAVCGSSGFVGVWHLDLSLSGAPKVMSVRATKLSGLHESMDVSALAFDYTGGYVAVGTTDGSICVWDAVNETLEHAIPSGLNAHKKGVTSLAFHPVRGHAQLTSGSLDGDGRVWDLAAEATEVPGECLHTLRWQSKSITSVKYTQCGRLIITATSGGRACHRLLVWSSVTGRLCKWYDAHTSRINSSSWHPHPGSRNVIVTGCDDGVVRVWSIRASPSGAGKPQLENGDHVGEIQDASTCDVRMSGAALCVSHSPMGGLVALTTWDGYLRIHDSETLEVVSQWRSSDAPATGVVWAPVPIAIHPEEKLCKTTPWIVVTADDEGSVSMWKVARGHDDDEDEEEEGEEGDSRLEARDVPKTNGIFTASDVKTWWDASENVAEVTPKMDAMGLYLGPSPEDKPIDKALRLGEAPEQLDRLPLLGTKYVDVALREGETASHAIFDSIESKIKEMQAKRRAFMSDATKSAKDKREYSMAFAKELEPLRAHRSRVYAALRD